MKPGLLPIFVGLVSAISTTAAVPPSLSSLLMPGQTAAIAQSQPTPQSSIEAVWALIQTARRAAAQGRTAEATAALVQAEQAAALLSNSNSLDQLLAAIAAEQAKLGQYDSAIAIARRMSYTTMPPRACCIPVRTEAEIAIVQAYLDAGQVGQARQFAADLSSVESRHQVLLPIVAHLAQQGQFTEAIALSQQTGQHADRARAAILKGYISTDRWAEALAFIQTITDPAERSSLLTLLSQWAWRSGQYDLSYQAANQIQEPGSKAQALAEVALAYRQANQPERALSILTQAEQLAPTQPAQLARWADYFAQIGAFDRALAIVNRLNGYEQADAKIRVARIYANSGQYASAIALAQQVQDGELQPFGDMPDLKVEALYAIVQHATKAGQVARALQAVNALKQGQHQVKALRSIAHHYRSLKQPQKAIAILNQAVTAARTVDRITIFYDRNTYFAVSNAGLLIDLAQDYLSLQQPERALAVLDEAIGTARTLKEANPSSVQQQVTYLSAIANRYGQLGQRDRALAAAESAANLIVQLPESQRSSVFPAWTVQPQADVAQMFYLAGATQQALDMLSSLRTVTTTIADPQQRLWGMAAIVKAYAAMDAEAQVKETVAAALQLAQTLEPAQRGWVTERFAIAAAAADPAYALQLVYSLPDRGSRLQTLAQIATNYHAAGQHPQAQAVVVNLQQVAATIPDDSQREQGLNDVIRNYFVPQGARNLSISQLLQAGQINADLRSPPLQAYNWAQIAQAYAAQGETSRASEVMQRALDAANLIRDRYEQRELLWQLLEETLQVGEPSLAAQIAAGFAAEPYRTVALQRVASQRFRLPGQ